MRSFLGSFWDWRYKPRKFVWYGGLQYLWFLPLRLILDYNRSDCVWYIPDYWGGKGTKVRTFFGLTVIVEEGAMFSYFWWKHLHNWKKFENERKELLSRLKWTFI